MPKHAFAPCPRTTLNRRGAGLSGRAAPRQQRRRMCAIQAAAGHAESAPGSRVSVFSGIRAAGTRCAGTRCAAQVAATSRSGRIPGGLVGGLPVSGDCVGVSAPGAAVALPAGLGVVDERPDAGRPGAGADPEPAAPGDEQCQAAGRNGLDPGHDVVALGEKMQMGTGSVMCCQRDFPRGGIEEQVDGTAPLIDRWGRECRCQFNRPTAQTLLRRGAQPRFPNAEVPQYPLQVVSGPGIHQGRGQLGSHLIFMAVSHT